MDDHNDYDDYSDLYPLHIQKPSSNSVPMPPPRYLLAPPVPQNPPPPGAPGAPPGAISLYAGLEHEIQNLQEQGEGGGGGKNTKSFKEDARGPPSRLLRNPARPPPVNTPNQLA